MSENAGVNVSFTRVMSMLQDRIFSCLAKRQVSRLTPFLIWHVGGGG
jgi:hypothetical protein